jgi:hypothetical protein
MILITGGSGEVGSKLAEMFRRTGYPVIVSSRSPETQDQVQWSLNERFELSSSTKLMGIVHCAYDFGSSRLNLIGTRTISEFANASNIPLINISSVLAEFHESQYGSNKREIEDLVREANQFNFRIGVISSYPAISNIRKLQQLVLVISIFPFPGIRTYVYETRLENLFLAITRVIDMPTSIQEKDVYVIEPIRRPLSELVSDSITDQAVNPKYINISIWLTVRILQTIAFVIPKFKSIADSFNGNLLLSRKKNYDLETDWISLS